MHTALPCAGNPAFAASRSAATGSANELTPGEMPSVIFGRDESRRHGKFLPASYRRRLQHEAKATAHSVRTFVVLLKLRRRGGMLRLRHADVKRARSNVAATIFANPAPTIMARTLA